MIVIFLKIAWRNILRNKIYSFINIIGLAVGLTASILLLLWVNDELSFDKFHKNGKNVFMVNTAIKQGPDKTEYWETSPPPLATFAKNEIPEIKEVCRISHYNKTSYFEYKEKKIYETNFRAADASLFKILSFPFVKGNVESPFSDERSVVLSQTLSDKIFGNEDPMGKVLKGSDNVAYHVTGIIKDIPDNSTIKCEAIFTFDVFKNDRWGSKNQFTLENAWGQYFTSIILLLNENANTKTIADKITAIHHNNQEWAKNTGITHTLQPITKMHLYGADGQESGMQNVHIFFIIAIVILIIAGINYVNLTTARSASRVKETGIKKIIGANRLSLFSQFICESIILFLISLAVATIIIYLLIPYYNELSGKNFVFNPLSANIIVVYVLAFIAVIILAGIYPAFILSSIKPLQITQNRGSMQKKQYLRKALVIVQFVSSIAFIIGAIVMNAQLKYIKTMNLGYDKNNTIIVESKGMANHFDAVKSTLLKEPEIESISGSSEQICNINYSTGDLEWEGKSHNTTFLIKMLYTGENFFKTFNVDIISGTGFTNTPADTSNCMLNETAVNSMGLKDPVGKTISLNKKITIVGVVKDFHFQNMHEKIAPLIIFNGQNLWWGNTVMYIKTKNNNSKNAIAAIEKIWKEYNQEYTFDYMFLDDMVYYEHDKDIKTGKLFNFFAIITILLCCMGLFGLVTYTTETKVKEIGIRKALGASVTDIAMMLSMNFIKMVCVAMVISIPLAWIVINKTLQNFVYHITPGYFIFISTGIIVLVITTVTVSFQAIKAAISNPAKSLRTE